MVNVVSNKITAPLHDSALAAPSSPHVTDCPSISPQRLVAS